jgi:flagellar protein FlaG
MSNLDSIGVVQNIRSVETSTFRGHRDRENLPQHAVKQGAQAETPSTSEGSAVDREVLEEYVAELNEIGNSKPPHLHFEIDDDTGQTIIKMTHRDSGELVRQIPSEEFLRIAKMVKNSEALNDRPGQWVELEV